MKKIFSILLSLALVVSLSVVAAAPVMAVELPSISPTSAEYDMDNPGHIAIELDVGDADDLDSIEDDVDALVADSEYYQFENLVVITETYLDSVLDCIGDEVVLQVNFDPFGVCFLTVTAVGTPPALEDGEAEWNFWGTDDVVVGIDWGIATTITDVSDDGGITSLVENTDWSQNATTLTIMGDTGEYLPTELTSMGDTVELTVEFDSCDYDVVLTSVPHTATLTIEAVGVTTPRIAPTSAVYDLCVSGDNNDIPFTITWDGAANIDEIWNVTSLLTPSMLTAGVYYTVSGTTLTIKDGYLDYCFLTLGLTYIYLEATFDDPATTKVNILITAEWSDQPFFGVTSNIYTYDLDTGLGNLGASGVGSLLNFGCATNVTGVMDNNGYHLQSSGGSKCYGAIGYDYTVLYILGYGYLVIITPYYLGCELTDLGDSRTMNVGFDAGANATFVINAVGTQPSISPASAEYNLDAPANVTTTVTWGGHATDIDAVTVGGTPLVDSVDYTWADPTLTILDSYLSTVLEEIDDVVVVTIDFDEGNDGKLTIKAVGTPLCFIATAAGADAPQLDILREFRDNVLRPNPLGAKLVSLYYKTSPPIAESISQNEALRTAVRVCLIDPIVAILNWSHGLWS